ncbi:MAG: beta-N-acetylhexosaminidase [Terracidiphilus sp.]|jgi:beta-N-acetylhexosaminidase
MESLRQAAGSLLAVGLEGTELTSLERSWLKLIRPAGIILFRRNIADAKQTRALLTEAAQFCAPHCVRFVDVEGGTVDRLRDVLAPIPPVQAVAQAARTSGRPEFAREHGELIARAVKAFGFNSPLSPVLDLGLPESQNVMETRCAGSAAADVVAYARGFLAGLASRGIAGCGKHFPGLGGGTLDSHLATPQIRRNWKQLWEEDLEPYRALRDHLPMVMVNHAAYPLSAGKKRPASVSSFWITDVLRKRFGYRGIVLSDDLEMGGVAKFMAIPDAAVDAVCVGSDMLLICHHPEPILSVYESLIAEGEQSAAFRRLLLARARNSARKRATVFCGAIPPALNKQQFEALRKQILRFTEKIHKAASSQERTFA